MHTAVQLREAKLASDAAASRARAGDRQLREAEVEADLIRRRYYKTMVRPLRGPVGVFLEYLFGRVGMNVFLSEGFLVWRGVCGCIFMFPLHTHERARHPRFLCVCASCTAQHTNWQ